MIGRWIAVAACLLLEGCEGVLPGPDLERMIDQKKYLPYAPSDLFADGRAMRPPPDGTVPHDGPVFPPAVATGLDGDRELGRVPIPVDRALLVRGRLLFDIHCAACHGVRGDGRSPVAAAMEQRLPPSLIDLPPALRTPGHLYRVASSGYGFMPSYATQLDVEERWAVVAYLGALALSQRAPLDRLPPRMRAEAVESLVGDFR